MKKKILGGLLVVAIAAVAAFNVNMNTQESELSLLALANVEALAGWESSGESSIKGDCAGSVIITDCYVNCPSCYTNWYSTPIIRNQKSYNISGSCSCGHKF